MIGFKKEKLTLNMLKANIVGGLCFIPIYLFFTSLYGYIWDDFILFKSPSELIHTYESVNIYLTIFIIVFGIVLHEFIHGLTWSYFTKDGLQSIKFGIVWKMLTPYCHCKEPLLIKHYKIGGIMPAIVLGFIPVLIGIAFENISFLFFGIFFTASAIGDFMLIYLLRNEKNDDMIQDHPSEIGCYVFRKVKNVD